MSVSYEFTLKLKAAIKEKLLSFGIKSVDELPDYVMILAANQKSKEKMEEDLIYFLGNNTGRFVEWLFVAFDQIQKSVNDSSKNASLEKREKIGRSSSTSVSPKSSRSNSPQVEKRHSTRKPHSRHLDTNRHGASGTREHGQAKKHSTNRQHELDSANLDVDMEDLSTKRHAITGFPADTRDGQSVGSKSKVSHMDLDEEDHRRDKEHLKSDNYKGRGDSRRFSGFDRNMSRRKFGIDSQRKRYAIDSEVDAPPSSVIAARKERFKDDYAKRAKVDASKGDDRKFSKSYVSIFSSQHNRVISNKMGKIAERCKYWPNCVRGKKCFYVHPSSVCTKFPDCEYGQHCFFIHPMCKFKSACEKPDCPYTHTNKKKPKSLNSSNAELETVSVGSTYVTSVKCQYGAKCLNQPDCPFIHETPDQQIQTDEV